MTKVNLDGMSHVEMVGLIDDIVKRIKTESFSEGYESGYEQARFDSAMENIAEIVPQQARAREILDGAKPVIERARKTAQERRDRIVEQAKADVTGILGKYEEFYVTIGGYENQAVVAKFHVNAAKRTVVALIYGKYSGKLYEKGIAKCAPGDCFNVHIGKAIALRRALGHGVPAEYLNAPQPTEVRVGDKIRLKLQNRFLNGNVETVSGFYRENKPLTLESPGHIYEDQYEIIDDSREGVSE